MSHHLRTPRLLVALGGLSYVLFPIPIVTLFWKEQIGLSLTETMVLQAIFGSASVLLEFPSGYAALAAFDAPWAVVFYLCFMTTRGLQGPILASVVPADAPPDDRASVLSLNALGFRLAFVVCGPAIGALVDRIGLEPALGVLAVAFAAGLGAALAVFARAHPAHRHQRAGRSSSPDQ